MLNKSACKKADLFLFLKFCGRIISKISWNVWSSFCPYYNAGLKEIRNKLKEVSGSC